MTHGAQGAGTAGWTWAGEARGAVNAAAAMLPFVLVYGLIAYGAAGTAATGIALGASVTSVVLGGLLMLTLSRTPLSSASPSASSCLLVASGVAVWLRDPALSPETPAGLASLVALAGACVVGSGLMLIALGLLRAGRVARFVPQPVLAGFSNGVAVLIALSQLPAALGVDAASFSRDAASAISGWQPWAVALTLAAVVMTWTVRRALPGWPAALPVLVLGTLLFIVLQAVLGSGSMQAVPVIGALQIPLPTPAAMMPLLGDGGAALLQRHGGTVLSTSLLLALIGALESVLSLAAVDQQQRRRSDADRALIALGAVNVSLGMLGALPVIYLRLRALATLSAGGRTWRAVSGDSALLALVFTAGLPLLALCPQPLVAGVVIALAWTLLDPWTLQLLRGTRSSAPDDGGATQGTADRRLSLSVVAAVGIVTVAWGFVWGVALGVLLSCVLLVRSLNRSLVRHRYSAQAFPSRRVYTPRQQLVLASAREGIVVLELEGALFFGNVDRLENEVRALLRSPSSASPVDTLVLDLRRVSAMDASGALMLARLRDLLHAQGRRLRLAGVTQHNRHGAALRAHGAIGAGQDDSWALHADADRATEAAELEALAASGAPPLGTPVPLAECELFRGLDAGEFERVGRMLRTRALATGERLFAQGEPGDALYVLSAGSVSAVDGARRHRFVSISPGMTFGELALLDGGGRTADAVADEPSVVHALDASALQALERDTPELATRLFRNLALHLATATPMQIEPIEAVDLASLTRRLGPFGQQTQVALGFMLSFFNLRFASSYKAILDRRWSSHRMSSTLFTRRSTRRWLPRSCPSH